MRCAANYTPLSPISFVERAAAVYGVRTAVVYGERRHSWRETRDRCVRVAAALATRFGLARGDVVPNRLASGSRRTNSRSAAKLFELMGRRSWNKHHD